MVTFILSSTVCDQHSWICHCTYSMVCCESTDSCECYQHGTKLNTDQFNDDLDSSVEYAGKIQNGGKLWICSSWNRAETLTSLLMNQAQALSVLMESRTVKSWECHFHETELNTDHFADEPDTSAECVDGIQNSKELWMSFSWNRAKHWPACWWPRHKHWVCWWNPKQWTAATWPPSPALSLSVPGLALVCAPTALHSENIILSVILPRRVSSQLCCVVTHVHTLLSLPPSIIFTPDPWISQNAPYISAQRVKVTLSFQIQCLKEHWYKN